MTISKYLLSELMTMNPKGKKSLSIQQEQKKEEREKQKKRRKSYCN